MYVLANKLVGLPVLSLQTGEVVGSLRQAIVDAASLELVAYQCNAGRPGNIVLLTRDVRQMAPDCVIVDSEDELVEAEDIVRVTALLKAGFNPVGKIVVTDLGRWLGTVEDYTINLETNCVQKLYVKQPMLRAWFSGSLIVDRTQIIDVTPRQVVVRDAANKAHLLNPEPVPETQA